MRQVIEPTTVMLEYRDADGIETRRTVDIQVIDEQNGVRQVSAFCHGRRSLRTFRVDRMVAIIDAEGEAFDPETFLTRLETKQFTDLRQSEPRTVEVTIGASPRHRLSTVGYILFWIAMLPGIVMAAVIVMTEADGAVLAVIVFTMLCGPVLLIAWIVRKIARRRRHSDR